MSVISKIKVGGTIYDIAYPIGSIYMSVNSTSPAVLFGGAWEQIKDTFLLACGDTYTAGSTGGEANHTLKVDEIPAHKHWMNAVGITNNKGASGTTVGGFKMNGKWNTLANGGNSDGYGDGTYTTGSTGGGAAHNNMPPYLAVYMWKRIA